MIKILMIFFSSHYNSRSCGVTNNITETDDMYVDAGFVRSLYFHNSAPRGASISRKRIVKFCFFLVSGLNVVGTISSSLLNCKCLPQSRC